MMRRWRQIFFRSGGDDRTPRPGRELLLDPPAPPGGPVGIKLPGKSATIAPPDAPPPSFVEGEVGSVSGKGPQSPIRPPTPLGGEPGSPVPPTSVPEVRSRTGRVVKRPRHLDTDFLLY